jgi:3-hydroxybutyryl-CoA dehydratase
MTGPLYFEDVNVGDRWTSGRRTVTETDVVMFAGLTGDYNPLHVDHEAAKQTPFGKPIAHGLLGVAWVAGLGSQAPMMKTDAFVAIRDWKFLKPTFIGDTVEIQTELTEKVDGGRRRGTCIWKRELVDQGGQVLQSGLFESLVAKRSPSRPKVN